MPEKEFAIGADIGGTHITCAAVHIRTGEIQNETLSRVEYRHDDPAENILRAWAEALNAAIGKTGADRLAGLGFAIPGPFDYRNGISEMKHKFPNLYGLHVPSGLKPLLKQGQDLTMRFLNDATSFAVGEAWAGVGRGCKKVVVITLGTGFGSAFLDEGIPVVTRADVPPEGCLWHLAYRESIADNYFSAGWFAREYEKRTGRPAPSVRQLSVLAASDPETRGLFATFGANLAEFMAPWLARFGAGILIVGGNIAQALPLFGEDLRQGLARAGAAVKTLPSALLERAALIGSARLLDAAFWEKASAELPDI